MSPEELDEAITRRMSELARIGGLRRAASMTPEQRSESARTASNARWARHRERVIEFGEQGDR